MGQHPYKGIKLLSTSKNLTAKQFASNMKKIRDKVGSALKKAAEDMSRYYDKKRSNSIEYNPGDRVWLKGVNVTTDQPMKKLGDKRWGPFKVIKKVSESSYKLNIPKTWKRIHPIFNKNLLTPYHEPEFPTQP